MHDSCINYANMLPLRRNNSWYQVKKKYKRDMERPGFLCEENKFGCHFLKNVVFSCFNIFWWKYSKISRVWGNCFNRLCQLLSNWIQINMTFKSNRSQKFYKIGPLENFTKFKWKHLRWSVFLMNLHYCGLQHY